MKKLVLFITFFPLLIVPLFCSCVQNVEAATVGAQSKADHHNHDCNCGHASSAILEAVIPSQVSFSFGRNSFPQITSVEPVSAPKISIHFAYVGPPSGKLTAVPLYIQQHSLRI